MGGDNKSWVCDRVIRRGFDVCSQALWFVYCCGKRRLAERSGQFGLVSGWGVNLDNSRLHQQMKEVCLSHLRGRACRITRQTLGILHRTPQNLDDPAQVQHCPASGPSGRGPSLLIQHGCVR